MFAAHCAYLEFAVDLGRLYLHTADAAIRRAIEYTRLEEPGRYFSRTLLAFFEGWQSIVAAMRSSHLIPSVDTADRLLFLSDAAVMAHLRRAFGDERVRLMRAVEYIQEQFDLIARRYIGGPRSLAVLDMAGLLTRAGFSPLHVKRALEEQIRVFLKEIESHGWSIDDGCSLCTGKALSVLALARAAPLAQVRVKNWLAGFETERFCVLEENYTGAARHEHAMHYAASVVHALLDVADDGAVLDRVIAAFFPAYIRDPDGLLAYWLKWRSEPTFWVGAHIFSTFLWLMQHPTHSRFLDRWKPQIAAACAIYLEDLKDEANIANVRQAGFLYAIRENLAALNIGRLLGVDGCTEPLAEVLAIFDRKVERTIERHRREDAAAPNGLRQRYPFDSSVDRTVRFIDNWLRYFESILNEKEVARDQAEASPERHV